MAVTPRERGGENGKNLYWGDKRDGATGRGQGGINLYFLKRYGIEMRVA